MTEQEKQYETILRVIWNALHSPEDDFAPEMLPLEVDEIVSDLAEAHEKNSKLKERIHGLEASNVNLTANMHAALQQVKEKRE